MKSTPLRLLACLCATAYVWGASPPAGAAQSCPDASQDIDTDRPDVTNSGVTVPKGSLQAENGINWTGGHEASLDGPDTRMRLGLASCTELFVDLPDYARPLTGSGIGGFSGVAPGIKRQFDMLPDGVTASAAAGILLPVGTSRSSADRYGSYIQFPWSVDMGEPWKINGMVTAEWFPRDDMAAEEATLSLARDIGPDADIFLEYIGDHRANQAFRSSFNIGGAYRLAKTRQIDIHIGFDPNAPGPFFGIGYSLRLDDLF